MGVNPTDRYSHLSIDLDEGYCPSCIMALASKLLKHHGIVRVNLSASQNRVVLDYNPNQIDQDSLEKMVQSTSVRSNVSHKHHTSENQDHREEVHDYRRTDGRSAVDPVCRMIENNDNTDFYSDYEGVRYFFCARSCKDAFDENPDFYASGNLSGQS